METASLYVTDAYKVKHMFEYYTEFKYLYPPRPETKATPNTLKFLSTREMWAQPKLNGSCSILATNGEEVHFMNRHNETFARNIISESDLRKMHIGPKGTWCYLVGEYMNKSQKDANGRVFNGCFVVFDMLVFNNAYLISSTLEERYAILQREFKTNELNEFLFETDRKDCYLVRNIEEDQVEAWNRAIEVEMIEGFVFKDPEAELERAVREKNNTRWMTKVRKPTKNYKY